MQLVESGLIRLKSGESIAVVSDGGARISDPGQEVIKQLQEGCLLSLPGPSAVITALVAASLIPLPLCSAGSFPAAGKSRKPWKGGKGATNHGAL